MGGGSLYEQESWEDCGVTPQRCHLRTMEAWGVLPVGGRVHDDVVRPKESLCCVVLPIFPRRFGNNGSIRDRDELISVLV